MEKKTELVDDLTKAFITIYKELKYINKEIMVKEGYSRQHGEILKYLKQHGKSKMTDIGKELMVTKSYVTALVDKLESNGLIRREQDEKDRRSILIGLTEEGEEVFRCYRKVFNEIISNRMSQVSEEELETLEEISSLMKKLEKGNFFTKNTEGDK